MSASASRTCAAIVLAAGAGTRMASELPKPLQPVGGRAMVLRVLDALAEFGAGPVVVVVGHAAERVREAVLAGAPDRERVLFATQKAQLGTGDAARAGLEALDEAASEIAGEPADSLPADVLVLPGDAPLLRASTLANLIFERRRHDAVASLLTARLDDPTGYGRIVRDAGDVRIVEQRDATESEARICEINAGVYCFELAALRAALPQLGRQNAAAEYYLTDVIGTFAAANLRVATLETDDPTETLGVNDSAQLAACEAVLASR